MKKLFLVLGCLALCLLAILGCDKDSKPSVPEEVHVKSVSVSVSASELTEGDLTKLTVTITPSDATNKAVTFKSDNPNVIAVDSQGNIMAVGVGTAKITVTAVDGGWSASVTITVKAAGPTAVTGVKLDKTSLDMSVGETVKLTATVEPSDADNKGVSWKSSASDVATVDNNGNVNAVKAGTATITVTTKDGEKTAACQVTVNPAYVPVTGVTLNKTSLTLVKGSEETLVATVLPGDASNKKVSWKSSNTNVATVDDNGKVTALIVGTATITVTTDEGNKTATCELTVTPATVAVTSVSLNKTSLTLTEGNSETLTATVQPTNATNKYVNWSTSDASVATVNSYGVVTAVKAGTATIKVKTADGNKTATCTVTVNAATVNVPVTGVSLNLPLIWDIVGETHQLTATVSPSNATNKSVTWSSSNTSVATVSSTGLVTLKSKGSAKITVTTVDGGFTATISVQVESAVTGVTLNRTSLSMHPGDEATLTATIQPADAFNQTVTWTSSDPTVASVNNSGKVIAKKEGTTDITVTTQEGGKTATCRVTVTTGTVHVTGVTLDATSIGIQVGQSVTLHPTVQPSNATNKSVTWHSSDASVATVDSNGKVTGKKAGTTTITVTTQDQGLKATCNVTVTNPPVSVTGVTLDANAIGMWDTQSYQLTATVSPSNATNKNVTWTSSNTSIVTVSTSGLVKGVTGASGIAYVTVKTVDGNYIAQCRFTITKQIRVTGVALDCSAAPIVYVGGSALLVTPVFTPANASVKTGTWTNSNPDAVSIQLDGENSVVIRGIKEGYSQVSFISDDGNYKASTTVNVRKK